MKTIKLIALLLLLAFYSASCTSIKASADYDTKTDFKTYKTFAFYTAGMDSLKISDLDKKRLLKEIHKNMVAKGYKHSKTPDVLISFSLIARDVAIVFKQFDHHYPYDLSHKGANWTYGWDYKGEIWKIGTVPLQNNQANKVSGTLYIDLIDNSNQALIWQGKGIANLVVNGDMDKKDDRITILVSEIFKELPGS